MSTTYSAVEVTRPGLLQLTQRPLKEPIAGQVRIRVEACGVCHSDSATVDGLLPGITFGFNHFDDQRSSGRARTP